SQIGHVASDCQIACLFAALPGFRGRKSSARGQLARFRRASNRRPERCRTRPVGSTDRSPVAMFRLRAPDIAASLCAAVLCVAALPGAACAATADEIIVKRDEGLTSAERTDVRADAGVTLVKPLPLEDTEVVRAAPGEAGDALADLRADPHIVWAEPNRVRDAAGLAEPFFPDMWALDNTGQTITAGTRSFTGTPGADIDAPDAWR